jgi:beta-mannosidase
MRYDISDLGWQLSGFEPFEWELEKSAEIGIALQPEIGPVPAKIPGSVQRSLHDAGLIDNWEVGHNCRDIEWIENRHWVYNAKLPADKTPGGLRHSLVFEGLDGQGRIFVNGKCIYSFANGFVEHSIDITDALEDGDNRLAIVFECSPRWLGQFGRTSQIRDLKARFNYGWDWSKRLMQIGVYGGAWLESRPDEGRFDAFFYTDYDLEAKEGSLFICPELSGLYSVSVEINIDGGVHSSTIEIDSGCDEYIIDELEVEPWQPNGCGAQKLYQLDMRAVSPNGKVLWQAGEKIGFKKIQWKKCQDSPKDSDPWLCCVNGRDIFLQGANWTPIRPNFADLERKDYEQRIRLYAELGFNIFRVWGGGFLESRDFYELCDQYGIMVWQEFPLSSSGVDNKTPDDDETISLMCQTVKSYVRRRSGHVSLLMWCGGNELQKKGPHGTINGIPLDESDRMLGAMGRLCREMDPIRRFIATSSLGPRFFALESEFGQGLHWDVHGPWKANEMDMEKWKSYWSHDDSLFRSETGCPGPSDAALIRRYLGEQKPQPFSVKNPLWGDYDWWFEGDIFEREMGRPPSKLEEYVAWGQSRQAELLSIAVSACKRRFPECGGIIIWMGHDSWPCSANTSLIDFEGQPKPAALELKKIFKEQREI